MDQLINWDPVASELYLPQHITISLEIHAIIDNCQIICQYDFILMFHQTV